MQTGKLDYSQGLKVQSELAKEIFTQFKERDEAAHHMILEATGKESSGRGRASALVNVDLAAEGAQTRVKVVTDLTISGPLAQFGRGAIAEVSSKLLGQFVTNLATMVLADEPTPTTEASTGTDTASAPATSAASATTGSADGGAPASPTATGAAPIDASASSSAPASGRSDGASGGAAALDATASGTAASGSSTSSTSSPVAGSPAAASTAAPSSGAGANASSPSATPRAGATTTSVPSTPRAQPAEAPAAEVNLLKVAAWPILKRVIPVLVVIAVIVILIVWLA